jgi:hypothetical protein
LRATDGQHINKGRGREEEAVGTTADIEKKTGRRRNADGRV